MLNLNRLKLRIRNARAWMLRTWRNPARREQIKARTTFALIAAFTVLSFDYLITGGPEWNPWSEAYAMEMPSPRTTLPVAPTPAPEFVMSTALTETATQLDYRFTTEELLGGPIVLEVESAPMQMGKPVVGEASVIKHSPSA